MSHWGARKSWLVGWLLGWVLASAWVAAQDADDRRPLEHEDYDRWNVIAGYSLSADGQWVMYNIRNGKQQTTLKIRKVDSDREYSVAQGVGGQFSADSRFAVYRITPDPQMIQKLRRAKTPPEKMPRAQLEVLHLESGRHATVENVQSFAMPTKGTGWVAFLLGPQPTKETVQKQVSGTNEIFEVTPKGLKRPRHATLASPAPASGKTSSEQNPEAGETRETRSESVGNPTEPKMTTEASDEEKKLEKEKQAGTTLVLRALETGVERRFPNVTEYHFSENGRLLVFATSTKEQPDQDGAWVLDLQTGDFTQVLAGLGNYRNLAVNKRGTMLAFITDRDDYQNKISAQALYLWRTRQNEATVVATEGTRGVPDDWWVSAKDRPQFSDDGRRLYFNTAPRPEDLDGKEDADEEEPKAVLDLWHWQDPLLQPQQLLQAEQERNRSYRAVYDIRARKVVQLATPEMPTVQVDPRATTNLAVGISREKYRKMMSWDLPGYQDSYLVDLRTGQAELIRERARTSVQMSPGGRFVIWWDTDSRSWFALPTRTVDGKRKPINLSRPIKTDLFDELHDTPSEPRPYGAALWLDDDQAVWVYDRYDIWQLDPTGRAKPVCVTGHQGRKNLLRFRVVQLDPEFRSLHPDQPVILSMFNDRTKASGYYRLDPGQDHPGRLEPLLVLDERIGGLRQALEADTVVFTRQTFRRCPDLWASDLEMKQIGRISRINPQQNEYVWGAAELVHWKSARGEMLDGILYKPDGFDPDRKYPLMVYFYERNSDNLHAYHAPAAGRSIINFSFYVSRGYVLFIPDIPYRTGLPGPSAADAVLPGVKFLVGQGYIDEKRIGMQGHSWGGYQTAYLVTQTDLFACAESGAPVSNMTSAYGGIRWGTGMSRMFQYERTQSRIGGTLWEARDKYIANSPLFHADKIHTPLLILHNDHDGAVPWYQGIELFVALRRLEKPAWLLNYNGEPHWVVKPENRLDFARRMQQFFDHYLQGAPMPVWMAEGIPAVDKGKEFGFEPVQEAPSAEPPGE